MSTSDISNSNKAELERITCLQTSHKSSATISIRADDGRTYLFATAQYLDGVHEANSKDSSNPRERLVLHFTTGEVVVLGPRLGRVEDRLADGNLRGLRTIEPRYAAVESGPIVLSITVNRKTDL